MRPSVFLAIYLMTLLQRWKNQCRTGQWRPNNQKWGKGAHLLGFRYRTPLSSLILKKQPRRASDWRRGSLLTPGERISNAEPVTPQNTKVRFHPIPQNLFYRKSLLQTSGSRMFPLMVPCVSLTQLCTRGGDKWVECGDPSVPGVTPSSEVHHSLYNL